MKPFVLWRITVRSESNSFEDETNISNDVEVPETMNEFFVTVTDSLGMNEGYNNWNATEGITDPVDAVHNFQNYPSILMDKQVVSYITPFLSSLVVGFRKGYNNA